jgi:hypothetical protein
MPESILFYFYSNFSYHIINFLDTYYKWDFSQERLNRLLYPVTWKCKLFALIRGLEVGV